jgi:phosphate transport system substrate-binding protein
MSFNTLKSVSLAALAAATLVGGSAAPAAAAPSTPIYGAGATLPFPLYRNLFNCYADPVLNSSGPLSTVPTQCSGSGYPLKPQYQFLYAPIGSGGGLTAFTTQTPPTATPSSTPFVSPDFPSYPYPSYDFSGSDAPMSATQLATYAAGVEAERGPAVQIPSVLTSVTVAFNDTGLNIRNPAPSDGVSGLRLSRAAYCGIFTGNITNWNDPILRADNNGKRLAADLPITVYRRSDSSGTTFLFARHLEVVCDGSSQAGGFNWTGGTSTSVTWDPDFIAVSGNQGVAEAVRDNDGAIGYVGPEFTAIADVPGIPNAPVVANLENESGNFRAPSIARTTAALGGITPPAVNSDAAVWGALNGTQGGTGAQQGPLANPIDGAAYPIVGFTYFEFYTCYAGKNKVQAISGFLNWLYNKNNVVPDQVVADNGLAPLNKAFKSAIRNLVNGTGGSSSDLAIQKGPVSGVCTL